MVLGDVRVAMAVSFPPAPPSSGRPVPGFPVPGFPGPAPVMLLMVMSVSSKPKTARWPNRQAAGSSVQIIPDQENAVSRSFTLNNIGLMRCDSKPTLINITRAPSFGPKSRPHKVVSDGFRQQKRARSGGGETGPRLERVGVQPCPQEGHQRGRKKAFCLSAALKQAAGVKQFRRRTAWRMFPWQRWRGLIREPLLRWPALCPFHRFWWIWRQRCQKRFWPVRSAFQQLPGGI